MSCPPPHLRHMTFICSTCETRRFFHTSCQYCPVKLGVPVRSIPHRTPRSVSPSLRGGALVVRDDEAIPDLWALNPRATSIPRIGIGVPQGSAPESQSLFTGRNRGPTPDRIHIHAIGGRRGHHRVRAAEHLHFPRTLLTSCFDLPASPPILRPSSCIAYPSAL